MEAKPVSRSVKRGALVGVLLLALLLITILPAAAITWGERDTTHTNVGAMIVDYPDYGLWQRCSGTLVHPPTGGRMQSVAWWCCRFIPTVGGATDDAAIGGLVGRVGAKVTWTQIQKLRRYGGSEGFTRAQG